MAYLSRRPSGRIQIRESIRGDAGPRSLTLASFAGALDDRVLDTAEKHAVRPFDRAGLVERARAMGIEVASSTNDSARALLGDLRRGRKVSPQLASLLLESLGAEHDAPALDDELAEAAEWLGRDVAERGEALRGLLRLSDAIVRARPPRRALPRRAYPGIDSARGAPDGGRGAPGDGAARGADGRAHG